MLKTYLRLQNAIEERKEGQGLVEYALIIVLVSVAAITTLTALAGGVTATFTKITTTL